MGLQGLKTGIILFTEKYEECVAFYRDVVELPVMYVQNDLTCFLFGGSYLMVEPDGIAKDKKDISQNPTTLRFDVDSFDESVKFLQGKGVDVSVQVYDWGTVGEFYDPDGHRCSLKKGSRL